MKHARVALIVALLAFAAACGSSKASAPTTTAPFWKTVPTVDMRGKATGTPPTVQVAVADNTFSPEVLRIDPGVTVVWSNHGAVVHDIEKNSDNFVGQFGDDSLASGATYQYKFATPGVYQYVCNLHTGMVGLVAVGSVSL